jgi:hypothetical protein
MRFKRCKITGLPRKTTGRILSAAKRAVEKDKAKNRLTPGLVKHQTAEERIKANNAAYIEWATAFRKYQADNWREARKKINALPALSKKGVIKYWNNCGLPGAAHYLLSIVAKVENGACAWSWLRKLKQIQMKGR